MARPTNVTVTFTAAEIAALANATSECMEHGDIVLATFPHYPERKAAHRAYEKVRKAAARARAKAAA